MAYDEQLAARVRRLLGGTALVTERKMFGGLAFLTQGKMCCGVLNDDLVVRLGPDAHEKALNTPHARPMDFTGRPMKGFLFVNASGLTTPAQLRQWVRKAREFVDTLAARKAKPTRRVRKDGRR